MPVIRCACACRATADAVAVTAATSRLIVCAQFLHFVSHCAYMLYAWAPRIQCCFRQWQERVLSDDGTNWHPQFGGTPTNQPTNNILRLHLESIWHGNILFNCGLESIVAEWEWAMPDVKKTKEKKRKNTSKKKDKKSNRTGLRRMMAGKLDRIDGCVRSLAFQFWCEESSK